MKKRRLLEDRYCLVTPARNEAAYLARTADAVAAQTVLPLRWVIVDDGSTDDTARIAEGYADRFAFVSVVRRIAGHSASFASKVFAFECGRKEIEALEGLDYALLGNLDADVTFGPRFFEHLLAEFDRDPRLGCAGGWVREASGGDFRARFGNSAGDVAGAAQLFRRECFDEIGGFPPLECGGEDTAAQACARMRGWRVKAFEHLAIDHHRPPPVGTLSGGAARFREGVRDRALGNHPVFEILKCLRRISERPYVLGAATRLGGYAWSCLVSGGPDVRPEVARFIRGEQLRRVRALFTRDAPAASQRR